MLANVTWPSLVLYEREHAWWIIIAVIAVEFWLLRRTLNTTPKRGFGIIVAINSFSALMGAIIKFPLGGDWGSAPPLVWIGLYWAFRVDGTFSVGSWGIAVLCAALLSTIFEGLLLFTVFYRATTTRCLFWLPIANLASAELTFLSVQLVSPW
jgi:hypothetical protein